MATECAEIALACVHLRKRAYSIADPFRPLLGDKGSSRSQPTNVRYREKRSLERLANALIQEGRISHECDSTEGQALEDGIRSIVIRLEEAVKAGLEIGGAH
jgi:hypothetical protein